MVRLKGSLLQLCSRTSLYQQLVGVMSLTFALCIMALSAQFERFKRGADADQSMCLISAN